MNFLISTATLLPIQQLINTLLQQDPHSQTLLSKHAGKVIEVCAELPSVHLSVFLDHGSIRLGAMSADDMDLVADAKVAGKSSDLFQLISADADSRPLANKAISITGDAHLVQDIFQIFSGLEIDWQDHLSGLIGDIATQQFSQLFRQLGAMGKQVGRSAKQNIDEYVHEELRLLPSKAEAEALLDDTDELRLRLDRLAARMESFQRQIESQIELNEAK